MKKAETYIKEMEGMVLDYLLSRFKEDGGEPYGYRKWIISKKTGIPNDILTPILRRLKYDGKIELIMIWDEQTGLPDGSGYKLVTNLSKHK